MLVDKALRVAIRAHQGQTDNAGKPYIHHPIAVADAVETEIEKAAALLHDVVEDSEITLADLQAEGFPETVVEAVRALTKTEGVDYFEYLKGVKNNPIAKAVKLSDLAHNMDLSRLREITEKDRERIEKYKKAIEYLNQ